MVMPGDDGLPEGGEADAVQTTRVDAPAVVAVVVTTGAEHLERCLTAVSLQDYPALTILVLDTGSLADRDLRRERIAAVAPAALLRTLDRHPDPVTASNDVIETVDGALFFCFISDDVELEPRAVSQLVEEAFRSNAAICGPKIVDRNHSEVLLEVGMAVDHYGVSMTGIEPGEIDQEQHDAVRDVFFVSHSVLLVRCDLFRELGGFDPSCAPGSEDLDLCWRARTAGARVVVVPDARARRDRELARRPELSAANFGDAVRARARTLLKNYSIAALVWVIPVATLFNVVESLAYLVVRKPRLARANFVGWWSSLLRMRSVANDRRSAQALRHVDDRDVRMFMAKGSARVRVLLAHRAHRNYHQIEIAEGWLRSRFNHMRRGARKPEVMVGVVFAVLLMFGARRFIFESVPSFAGFQNWTSAGDLLGAWGGRWRFNGLGADASAPTSLGIFGMFSALLLGNAALAQSLVIFGSIPVGLLGMYRLTRSLSTSALPASVAVIAYGANPILRNAFAKGQLSALVFFALIPYIASRCVLIADGTTGSERRRAGASLLLLTALVASVAPIAALFPVLIAIALLVAVPIVGGGRSATRVGLVAVGVIVGTVVLLWPWSLSVLGGDGFMPGFSVRQSFTFSQVVTFRTGSSGAGILVWLLFPAAGLPLLVATEQRFAWAVRAWCLALVAFLAAWLPGWLGAKAPVPPIELVLMPAAFGLALAVGLGYASFIGEIRSFVFGIRQAAAITMALCITGPALGVIPDIFESGYDAPRESWASSLEFLARQAEVDGDFRVLWIGRSESLPLDPVVSNVRYSLGVSRNGAGDIRDVLPSPDGSAKAHLEDAMDAAIGGSTALLGNALSSMGVRYLAVVDRAAPDVRPTAGGDLGITATLRGQLDLTLARSSTGLSVFENEAWVPMLSLVSRDVAELGSDKVAAQDALGIATRTDLKSGMKQVRGPNHALKVASQGTLVLSEPYNTAWKLSVDGKLMEHERAFGWTNAFTVSSPGKGRLSFDGGLLHPLVVVVPILMFAAAIVAALWRKREEVPARALVFAEPAVVPAASRRALVRHRHFSPSSDDLGIAAEGPDDNDDLASFEASASEFSDDFDWSVLSPEHPGASE